MPARRIASVVTAGAAALLLLPLASATPGALDPRFGDGGRVMIDFGGSEHLSAVAVAPDGGIVAAGLSIDAPAAADFALLRLRTTGLPDDRFGTNGRVVTDVGAYDVATSVAVQPDGSTLVAGTSSNRATLLRYTRAGVLDTAFGANGVVRLEPTQASEFVRVLVQPNGKLVAVGRPAFPQSAFVVARFERNGTLDGTFGRGGIVATAVDTAPLDAALGPNGTIVAAGTWRHPDKRSSGDDFPIEAVVVRYLANGRLDRRFGGDGIVRRDLRPNRCCELEAVAVQRDGRVLIGGFRMPGGAAVLRLRPNGTVETSFGRAGTATLPTGASVGALALDRRGGVVAAIRQAGRRIDHDLGVARLTRLGALDPRFGTRGIAFADFGVNDDAWDVAVQRDGKVVVGGYTGGALLSAGADNDFAIARYAAR